MQQYRYNYNTFFLPRQTGKRKNKAKTARRHSFADFFVFAALLPPFFLAFNDFLTVFSPPFKPLRAVPSNPPPKGQRSLRQPESFPQSILFDI